MPAIAELNRRSAFPHNAASRAQALTAICGGLAGGLAEVVWVGLYCWASGASGLDIARRVADAAFPGVLQMPTAPTLGLAIHFGLSALLGLFLVWFLTHAAKERSWIILPICLGALGLIWALNFMVVLPVFNPIFPALLPAWATLISKLLFGVSLALVVIRRGLHAS